MQCFRLNHDQIHVRRPLPWNVFNEEGQLLLHRGYVLLDDAQVKALIERGAYVDQVSYAQIQAQEAETARAERRQNPHALWHSVQQRMKDLLRLPIDQTTFHADVDDLASDLRHGLDAHRDATLFEALQGDDPASYAVSHAMQTAFVASLVGERMGWSDGERHTLTQAALTMNLGMTDLQTTLSLQLTPPSKQQRQAIDDHAHEGRARLEAAGVVDAEWLRAVEQHHVTPNGGPLPAHHAQLSEQACMLHYTDVYLAKISARASRPALPSHVAARGLFLQAGGQHNPYVSAIIKEIGVYPPGSCVKLANGELGIVVRRGEAAHEPEVRVLVDGQGQAMLDPLPRDTSLAPFKVIEALPRGSIKHQLNRAQVFASA